MAELLGPTDRVLLVAGGRGGRGNAAFKTARNNAPALAERGEKGAELWFDLELKLVADVSDSPHSPPVPPLPRLGTRQLRGLGLCTARLPLNLMQYTHEQSCTPGWRHPFARHQQVLLLSACNPAFDHIGSMQLLRGVGLLLEFGPQSECRMEAASARSSRIASCYGLHRLLSEIQGS